MATNASFIYYRDKSLGFDLDKKITEEILGISGSSWTRNININGIVYKDYFEIPKSLNFSLKTVYPGLVIGSGYNHPPMKRETDNTSDFQLGFFFDHTTGMPVIPGSTVKGVLKSVFPKQIPKNIKDDEKKIIETINSEKLRYANSIISKENLFKENNWENLFDKGNIFYDAYVSDTPSDGKIFAEDYITPHTQGPFKNPIPIRFLKIAPRVTFTFQFKLVESKFEDITIAPEDKLKLFKKILLDFGIGAKRNVGYGNFVEVIEK